MAIINYYFVHEGGVTGNVLDCSTNANELNNSVGCGSITTPWSHHSPSTIPIYGMYYSSSCYIISRESTQLFVIILAITSGLLILVAFGMVIVLTCGLCVCWRKLKLKKGQPVY